ncbi:MAG: DUF2273 domain-containing protein [Firmicutes bacterium]|nr:DUF2273 domain-containing protein [Bacillota bacterium]
MFEKLFEYVTTEHRGKAIGVLLGLIASVLFVTYGFWSAIFILLCIVVGYQIGKQIDDDVDLELWVKNLLKIKK